MSPDAAAGVEIGQEEVTASVEIGRGEVIDRIADRWQRLCDETRSAPFHRPEWIASYIRAFEPNSEIVLLTASAGERLVAVLPMVRKRCWYAGVPLVKLTGAANVHSVRFDILRSACAAGEASIQVLWRLLKRTPGWQVLEFPYFPKNGACAELLTQASTDGYLTRMFPAQDSPILRMQPDGNGRLTWLGGTSRHFRHELRRYARVLEAETGAKPKVTRWIQPDPTALKQFFDLEAAGWKGREGSAINCEPETQAFYNQIARQGADGGYFCLHSLEVNGTMAAGAFSVMTQDCFFPMKVAYNEALHRGGPGHLLFNSILEECAEKRIPELFFGGARDRYKDLWTQETIPHFRGFVFAPDFRSQLACQIRTKVLPMLGKLRRYLRDRFGQGNRRRIVQTTQSDTRESDTRESDTREKVTSQSHPRD
jgi:CelD/BcsL family acetyltransferase involved in cellulose biosynthesis